MKKLIALLGSITAVAMTIAPASAATVIPVGTTGNPFFTITGQTPTDNYVTANFGATFGGGQTFDDVFTFFLPLMGTGSGSVSTSFSSVGTFLKITDVVINGATESVSAAASGISGIPISAFAENTVEVKGYTPASTVFGTFAGTLTFTSSAVPEPSTWATFLLGFALLGLGLRRRAKGLATA